MNVTFWARRSDGFGERLRAMLNALALRNVFGGSFAFRWELSEGTTNKHHDVLPVKDVFSSDFIRKFRKTPEDHIPLARFFQLIEENPEADLDGVFVDVPHYDLEYSFPEIRNQVKPQDYIHAFEEIIFSSALAHAVDLARRQSVKTAAVSVHARAGDIIFGKWRCCGKFTNKAVPYPLVTEFIKNRIESRNDVLLFGQDIELCSGISRSMDAIDVGSLHHGHGLTSLQSALFDIVLMSRSQEIACGVSGFALVA